MTDDKAPLMILLRRLRRLFRDRDDHHHLCQTKTVRRDSLCDCYAAVDARAHYLIDLIEGQVGNLLCDKKPTAE